jgi:hypothetical protein
MINMLHQLTIKAVVAFLLLSTHYTSPAKEAKLYPVDEASRVPSFFVFRARLLEALQQRDTSYVISAVSPNIKNSFGGSDGIAEFKQGWKLERPDSKFWKTMTGVLALGGSFNGDDSFAAPYTFSKFPEDFDAFEYGVIVGENVRVRKEPKLDSQVIATLSFDIVKVTDWMPKLSSGSKQEWISVSLANDVKGYIAKEYIRSPIDYRAIFEKKDGKWQLTAFVSGD